MSEPRGYPYPAEPSRYALTDEDIANAPKTDTPEFEEWLARQRHDYRSVSEGVTMEQVDIWVEAMRDRVLTAEKRGRVQEAREDREEKAEVAVKVKAKAAKARAVKAKAAKAKVEAEDDARVEVQAVPDARWAGIDYAATPHPVQSDEGGSSWEKERADAEEAQAAKVKADEEEAKVRALHGQYETERTSWPN